MVSTVYLQWQQEIPLLLGWNPGHTFSATEGTSWSHTSFCGVKCDKELLIRNLGTGTQENYSQVLQGLQILLWSELTHPGSRFPSLPLPLLLFSVPLH